MNSIKKPWQLVILLIAKIGMILIYSLLLAYTISCHMPFAGEHATVMDYFLPFSSQILNRIFFNFFSIETDIFPILRAIAVALIIFAILFYVFIFVGLLKRKRWSIWTFLSVIIILTARFGSMFLLVFNSIVTSNIFGRLFLVVYLIAPAFLIYCSIHCLRSGYFNQQD